jgi:hypothetical protein
LASKARSRSRSVFSVGIFECRHVHASKDVDLVYFYAANLSAEAEADLERRLRLYFKRLRVKLDAKNEQGYAAADPKIAVIAWHANRFCPRVTSS